MDEASARQVLLVQAFETAQAQSPSWTAEDREWASRAATDSVGAACAPETFIVQRASHAMQRLAPREPAVAEWLGGSAWGPPWIMLALLVGCVAGLAADSIGGRQRINLLAPPIWGVIAWNLAVYAFMLWQAARGWWVRPRAEPGKLARALQRLLRVADDRPMASAVKGSAAVFQSFGVAWARHGAALSTARAATLLHAAAAALALGLMGGLYLRGLVLDYRAGWESTFLDAATVHATLSLLLAPAVAVSGIALPDASAFEALRFGAGRADIGTSAAPWIRLYIVTMLIVVVLPRAALALWNALRSVWLAQRFPLVLDGVYFQTLARQQRGDVARITVIPYAYTPHPPAVLGLRAVLARVFGAAVQVLMANVVPFGAEEDMDTRELVPRGSTVAVALFDMVATPEAENQGRFMQLLVTAAAASGHASVLVLIDETAFARRFGPYSERMGQRRDAWRALAEAHACVPVFVGLESPDEVATERALQAALAASAGALA